uniref:NnrS family protein n=1 Tax=Sulfurovum sp. TaxID=1969726 RepID=UPI0025F273A7
ALGTASASLAILNDFIAYDETNILGKRLIRALMTVPVLVFIGYALIGYNYLTGLHYYNGDLLHMLTSGAWTLSFYLVMIVITIVHTGRDIAKERNVWICISIALIIISAFLRTAVAFYPTYAIPLYMTSAVVWSLPFAIYIKKYFKWLVSPRADGIPG